MKSYIDNFVKYRWLLCELVSRDLKVKYRRSILGYVWSLLNPLLMMVVISAVFSQIFRYDIDNFPIYLMSGQLVFNFFSEATSTAMTGIIQGGDLIKKVYIPKYIFPVSRVLSAFVNLFCSFIALILVMIITGTKFHITLILAPILLAYILVFSIGLGLVLATFAVYFRDMIHLYGVFITALMYFTPLFYPVEMLTDELMIYIQFNPMFHMVNYARDIILYGTWPSIGQNLICGFLSILMLVVGLRVFKNNQDNFILHI